MTIEEYTDETGRNLYRRSFERLDDRSQIRVAAGIARMMQDNFGRSRRLSGGIWEQRFLGRGAGPRLYYARMGEELILLLVAGDKSSAREQQADIDMARAHWDEWLTKGS